MAKFRVWAPAARRSVEVEIGDQHLPLQPAAGIGWYELDVPWAGPGTDYFYRIDDGPRLPDPRSAWQPQGVFGPSRVVDHSAFHWTDELYHVRTLGSGVVYELHVGTFTPEGTFRAAIEKLDYLAELGITHIDIMPVHECTGVRGWGYDGADLFAPFHPYGTPEDLKALVNAAHRLGLGVLLDVVYNHLGPEGTFVRCFGPYFSEEFHTPWGAGVNFDGPFSDEVRRFFIDNALLWLRDYHMDGLRLDGVFHMIDLSAMHFVEQLGREVHGLSDQTGRTYALIIETSLNDPRMLRPTEAGGNGMDAQWNDDFHHTLRVALTHEHTGYYADYSGLSDLAKSLKTAYVFDGTYSRNRNKLHGRSTDGLSGHRFFSYMQNHDQIGNRAKGDRINSVITPGQQQIGSALVLCSPFVPMLFMGEEWAASSPFAYFADYQARELREAVTEGRRKEFLSFGWKLEEITDALAVETFEQSKLKWEEKDRAPHANMLQWYRQLIALRLRSPDLLNGDRSQTHATCDEKAQWLILWRGAMTVLCNFSEKPQALPLPGSRNRNLLLANQTQGLIIGPEEVCLPGHAVAILGPAADQRSQCASESVRQ